MRIATAASMVAALVTLAGCPESGYGPVPLEQLAPEMAETWCEAVPDCYGPSAWQWGMPDDCVPWLQEELESGLAALIQQAVERGTAVYDPEAMRTCLAEIARTCVLDGSLPLEVCQVAVAGVVETGGDCEHDFDCVGDDFCEYGARCPGTCTARAREGESCGGIACEHGTHCKDGDVCVPWSPAGAACGFGDCEVGLVCSGDTYWGGEGQTDTCMTFDEATVGEGERCYFLESVFCAEGLRCVLTDLENDEHTCEPAPVSGGPCRAGNPDPCPSGEYCDYDPAGDLDGTCRRLPVDGEPCTEQMLACAPGHACNEDAMCEMKRRLGEACPEGWHDICYSDRCGDGVCAVRTRCE